MWDYILDLSIVQWVHSWLGDYPCSMPGVIIA